MRLALGRDESAFTQAARAWQEGSLLDRLWKADASLWTDQDEDQWLGWLSVLAGREAMLAELDSLCAELENEDLRHVVVMGMGGSSLCPDVLSRTLGSAHGTRELLVLDSTVPAQIRTLEAEIDIARTIFVMSSKSGGTIEPNMFKQYFFAQVERALGAGQAGRRFIAITDPGTKLDALARDQGFRHIAHGVPTIGGRFSALSMFGMLPAALLGLNVRDMLERAATLAERCGPQVAPLDNPGASLGLALGTLAKTGRDKLSLILSPGIAALGGWIEQLVAESTGKHGIGIVPVDAEGMAAPAAYGDDRLFVYQRLERGASPEQDSAVAALEAAGHPLVQIDVAGTTELCAEFFRWEMATAVAGAVLGINPFDQPDVEAAKVAARGLMDAYEQTGHLDDDAPPLDAAGVARLLGQIRDGDYFSINAYVEMNEANHRILQALRHAVRDAKGVATTLGYGPRFLHSTGQLHKGGADNGVFLEITADDARDLEIPGQRFSFGVLARAQAQGDFQVLVERERRALRVHLGADVPAGLESLREVVARALNPHGEPA